MNVQKEITKDAQNEAKFRKALGSYAPQFSDELGTMKKVYSEQLVELVAWRMDAEIYDKCVEIEPDNEDMKTLQTDKQRGYKLKQEAIEIMRRQILQLIDENKRTQNGNK